MPLGKVGRYEIVETLARGGMGVVYKARDPLIDRVVAVKTLGFGLSPIEAQAFRKRFAREAKSAGRLNHPNIVTIHDMGESDDGAYIAMEFLEGASLREVLDSGVVLPAARAADIALQVAEGLAFAHRNDVVHCDIKPGNVMVLDNGAVKITDFGIAMLPTGSRTFAGNVLGSPRYISPEQIVGRPVDARSDIFSLGAVLYEMLAGVPPFAGEAIDEILYQVINDKPEPPSVRDRSVPPEFDAIVERAMAKDPGDRFAKVEDMAAALRPLARASPPAEVSLPSLAAIGRAQPGATTVSLEADEAAADEAGLAAPSRRRKLVALAIPAVLAATGTGWMWNALRSDAGAQGADVLPTASPAGLPARAEPARVAVMEPVDPRPTAAPSAPVAAASPPVAAKPPAAAPTARAAGKAPSAPIGLGRLGFAVSPWGEIFVDGRKRGVSPPLTELRLPPGRYRIEIRNATFAPHTETVEIAAGAALRIKHKFQ
jgi:serine/threonine-protein kinase